MPINLNILKGFKAHEDVIIKDGLDIFGWKSIDGWIQTTCQRIGIPLNSDSTLEFQRTLNNGTTNFGTLGESRVYEAGHFGAQVTVPILGTDVTSGNDCLLHSFLSCTSPTFRMIRNVKIGGTIYSEQNVRNCIATIFRRLLMPTWFPDGTLGYDNYGNEIGDSLESILDRDTLEEYTGVRICEQFGLNILFVQDGIPIPTTNAQYNAKNPNKRTPPNATFYNHGSDSTICIFGAPNHFQPVELNDGMQVSFILTGFDGDTWHTQTFAIETACKFKVGDTVTYKDRQYWVMELKYDNGPPECTHITLLEKTGTHKTNFPNNTRNNYGEPSGQGRNWSRKFRNTFIKVPVGEITAAVEAMANIPLVNRQLSNFEVAKQFQQSLNEKAAINAQIAREAAEAAEAVNAVANIPVSQRLTINQLREARIKRFSKHHKTNTRSRRTTKYRSTRRRK